MYIADRTVRFVRGFLMSYGPSKIKKLVWDKEFARGKWNFIDNTAGDCVYAYLEQYARRGNVLDLGCGPGNTANELSNDVYRNYLGVDISQEALFKAEKRSKENGRGAKNRFVCSDFLAFEPNGLFDVILFRESLYHVPVGKIRTMLDHYTQYLTPNGVFIVRLYLTDDGKEKQRPRRMINIIETAYEVIDKGSYGPQDATVVVFRPGKHSQQTSSVKEQQEG